MQGSICKALYARLYMLSAKSICREVNCNEKIPSPGYCDLHKRAGNDRFSHLQKAPGSRDFYGSNRWRKTAEAYRQANPLCEGHKAMGLVVKGDLVDHKVERPTLEAQGLDPFDFQYLQTLCHGCHNKKLGERRSKQGRDV